MIAKLGTTIGKRIFGIRVLDADGEKLTLEAAKKRTYSVFKHGMGYCIPLYDLYRQYKSYGKCKEGELVWDAGISYEVEDNKVVLRMIIGYVLLRAVAYGANMLVAMCL
ncbi:RDD family protein [Chakrabartyella piscis]|uniref:RDD family protein n=1 Tax=Chakrabartyella piscis TaxID=2918914 RepID=UPI0029589569|nr:RDD family protein [Chakrabartyella piscis]